jgi:hypothetical protein
MSITIHSGEAIVVLSIKSDNVPSPLSHSSSKLGIRHLSQLMARQYVSITIHNGRAMVASSIMGDFVPLCIQSRKASSASSCSLTPMNRDIYHLDCNMCSRLYIGMLSRYCGV